VGIARSRKQVLAVRNHELFVESVGRLCWPCYVRVGKTDVLKHRLHVRQHRRNAGGTKLPVVHLDLVWSNQMNEDGQTESVRAARSSDGKAGAIVGPTVLFASYMLNPFHSSRHHVPS